ncbi:MAG TPA: hypothetical protein VJ914_04550 [Pseudonocardiaceae bacterium]|nr:hypothetical protein [Pseudonocardiaceae bacterium]
MIGGVVVAVALLVVFVGGFAWPGWFTSSGDKSTSPGPTPATAQLEAQRFITAINQQDSATLQVHAALKAACRWTKKTSTSA